MKRKIKITITTDRYSTRHLEALLALKGWPQKRLADELGISCSHVWRAVRLKEFKDLRVRIIDFLEGRSEF